MRIAMGALAAVAALAAGTAAGTAWAEPADAPLTPLQIRTITQLKTAAEAFDADKCPASLKLSEPLIDAPDNSGLPDELAALAYEIAMVCELRTEAVDKAYRHALRGSALEHSSDMIWDMRFALESDRKDLAAAVATVEAMSHGRGAALNKLPSRLLFQLDVALRAKTADPGLRPRFLAVLAADAYLPEEPFTQTDSWRRAYAGVLWDAGDHAGAATLVRRIDDPADLVEVSLDSRFAPAFDAALDVRAAAERKLARDELTAKAHPDLLKGVATVAEDLRRLGRAAEALSLIDATAPLLGDRKAAAKRFSDLEDQEAWFWNERSLALSEVGRRPEARAQLAKAAALLEDGRPNASQTINLAEAQFTDGLADEALKTLAVFDGKSDSASPYGLGWVRSARACALFQKGDLVAAKAQLEAIKAHEADNPAAVTEAMQCAGDMDGIAASFIRRLDDPQTRGAMLAALSDFDEPDPALQAPLQREMKRRADLAKARPDVQAAIARNGRTRRFHIASVDF